MSWGCAWAHNSHGTETRDCWWPRTRQYEAHDPLPLGVHASSCLHPLSMACFAPCTQPSERSVSAGLLMPSSTPYETRTVAGFEGRRPWNFVLRGRANPASRQQSVQRRAREPRACASCSSAPITLVRNPIEHLRGWTKPHPCAGAVPYARTQLTSDSHCSRAASLTLHNSMPS